MDNLCAHKTKKVRELVEEAGCELLYVPPYSPDLNPIEQVFAKLKALLRREAPRSRDALWRSISELLDRFSPTECQNYITAAGYRMPS